MLNIVKTSMKDDGRSPIVVCGAPEKALSRKGFIHRAFSDESGQVLPWVVLLLLMFLGMSALVVDVGHAMLVQRQLQSSTDAAALAAAQVLPSSTYRSVALKYSAQAGQKNAYGGISVGTPTVTGKCLSTVTGWGISCSSASSNWNAVTVSEQATIPSIFAEFVGVPSLTVGATSTASRGAKPQPFNIAIVLDTTASMNTTDPNCGGKTQLACAENAIAIILEGLAPTQDNVSLFTFPAMETTSVSADTDCSTGTTPTGEPYTFPSTSATTLQTMPFTSGSGRGSSTVQTTYQITGYLADYRASDTAKSLASGSLLTKAIGSSSGCGGAQLNTTQNTYFASTLYQAQASLLAEQAANPGTMNAIIFLSDGNATAVNNSYFSDMATSSQTSGGAGGVNNSSDGKYPNLQGECGQAVDAASAAGSYVNGSGKADNTVVYTIAYGSPSTSTSGGRYGNQGNCASDIGAGQHPGITPCQTLQQMSTGWNSTPQNTSYFYSDYYAPGGDSGCQASGPNQTITALSDIATSIVGQFTGVRLIPPSTP